MIALSRQALSAFIMWEKLIYQRLYGIIDIRNALA